MRDDQFELGGVLFGKDCPVDITADGWNPAAGELRGSSEPNPIRNGVRFGRRLRGSALWQFKLFTNLEDEAPAWDALAELKEAWDADDLDDGDVVPLRYTIAGQTRRVYGQPQRWTPTISNDRIGGNIGAVCDFELIEDTVYEDDEQSVVVPLGLPFDPDAGIITPFTPPVTFDAGSVTRESEVEIGGDKKTPIAITFRGPLTNAMVRIGDWSAGVVDPIWGGPENTVTIDGRPWVVAATRRDGSGVRVDPRNTRISKMWLPPGRHQVVFTGESSTGAATATVTWRNALRTPR